MIVEPFLHDHHTSTVATVIIWHIKLTIIITFSVFFNDDSTCVADCNCPLRLVCDPITDHESFETNEDFKFRSGLLCVESCPSKLHIKT